MNSPSRLQAGNSQARLIAFVCLGLVIGTLLLFSRSAGLGFLNYDDPTYVTQNPHVMAGLHWEGIVWAFTGLADYWHPLSWMGHMLDWQLFGADAAGHHWVSVGWHAVNAVLVLLVLRRFTGSIWFAAFGAALFAWHPLRVESVTWITERKDVMSGFFFLLMVLAHVAYADRRREGRRAMAFYLAALCAFACGLMSKPMVVTAPVVLLLLDFWPLRRAEITGDWRSWRTLFIEKIPFFALSIVASVVTVHMQHAKGGLTLDVPLAARMGNALVSVARYLGKFFWPTDLVVCYPHPGFWPWVAVTGAGVSVAAISLMAWRLRTKEPWLLFGWAWFLVMLMPVIGIVQAGFQAMADRYTYLPMLGWLVVCICAAQRISSRKVVQHALTVFGVVALAALASVTWRQQRYWVDSITLFEHALAVDETNPFAHGFLGFTLAAEGRTEEAESHSRRAVQLDPGNTAALITLAHLSLKRGDRPAAVEFYKRVLAANPRNPTAHLELGQLLLAVGNRDEAVEHIRSVAASTPELVERNMAAGAQELGNGRFGQALVLFQTASIASPDDALAHFWSGVAFARLGRQLDALDELKKSLELAPDHAGAHVEMGLILLVRDQAAGALRHFQRAIDIDPKLAVAQLGAAQALLSLGRSQEAMGFFEEAARISPEDGAVQKAWGEALARVREFDAAAQHYALAVKLSPDDADARAGYGYMLVFTNRPDEAIREWEEALRLKPDLPGLRGRLESLRITTGR